jgi:hypothetical protein
MCLLKLSYFYQWLLIDFHKRKLHPRTLEQKTLLLLSYYQLQPRYCLLQMVL